MPLQLPSWSQTKTTSKQGFDKVYNLVDKLGAPVNKLSNKLGSEAFWPTTLDKESDKAARILRSFCKDGFYVEEEFHVPSGEAPKGKVKVVKKIPTEVIRKAKGLAIFTTMRTGLWVSGAGGSGILVARTEDGTWSPPSGIMLHTAGLGFLVGVDIYDCVVVINTEKALEAFSKIRCTLGGEVSAVAGPVGVGGVLETELHKRQAPVFNYLKSRGFYAGVQIDGTVIIERTDENERFYGEKIGVADILAGKVRHAPYEIRTLMATIKAAQGDKDVDENALPAAEPTPGDYEVHEDTSTGFGLPPSEDDPDPYGVRALEQEGMEIREAGTKSRPSSEAFEYKPAQSSPIFTDFNHQNSTGKRNSRRDSGRVSIASIDRGTQTEIPPRIGESPTDSPSHSPIKKTSENLAEEFDDGDLGHDHSTHEAPHESPILSRAKLVTIPKRIPPALPPRNPDRQGPVVVNAEMPAIAHVAEHHERGPGRDQKDQISPPGEQPPKLANAEIHISPSENALEERLDQMHLPPPHDPDRLSPRKDGFDDISLSGSDYSRETPGESGIGMIDNEATHEPPAAAVEKGNEPATKGTTNETEEFHSMPSTPVEAESPAIHEQGEGKEHILVA